MELNELWDKTYRTADGVFAVDQSQRIIFWNQGAVNILGFTPDEVIGKYCFDVVRGVNEAGQMNCVQDCQALNCSLNQKLTPGYNLMVKAKDGSLLWLSMTHASLNTLHVSGDTNQNTTGNTTGSNPGESLVHIFRDVTKEVQSKLLLEQIAGQISGQLLASPMASIDSNTLDAFESQATSEDNNHGTNSADADLTDREKQVLGLLATGETTNGIARRLVISNTTTRNHIQNILVKLELRPKSTLT